MTSHTTEKFRKAFRQLPAHIQRQAREAYRLWKSDPHHGSLQFKRAHTGEQISSVRVGIGWRALGAREGDTLIWFWSGSHAAYEKVLSQL